jgi:DNA repair exonuclease SbcCD ATPase subunit
MTDEERQRHMDFILEQQAKFEVNIQKLEEKQKATTENLNKIEAVLARLVEMTLANTQAIAELRESQKRTDEQLARTDEQMARTDEKLARTDERLNILIGIVERHITDGPHRN